MRLVRLKHRFVRSVSSSSFSIPTVDFAGFREVTSRQKVAAQIVAAFKDSGFVYLSGHGIPSGWCQCFNGIYLLMQTNASATIQQTFDKVYDFGLLHTSPGIHLCVRARSFSASHQISRSVVV
jgi:hypothetical protein